MACKTNKVKRLYCYVAIVVVLTWLGNVPKTMANMIVAGSSASQQALRDARGKRQLQSNSRMTEENDGDDEDRGVIDLNRLPDDFETLIELKKLDAELEAGTTKINEITKELPESAKQKSIKSVEKNANPGDDVKVTTIKSSDLSTSDEDKMLSALAAGENGQYDRDLVRRVFIDRVNTVSKSIADANGGELTRFLAGPIFKAWDFFYKKVSVINDPYSLLVSQLLMRSPKDFLLAKQLAVAKEDNDVKNVAAEVEEHLMLKWLKNKKSRNNVFDGLGLNQAGISMLDSPVWETWVSSGEVGPQRKKGDKEGSEVGPQRKRGDKEGSAVGFVQKRKNGKGKRRRASSLSAVGFVRKRKNGKGKRKKRRASSLSAVESLYQRRTERVV